MSETLTKDKWIARVLGVSYQRPNGGRSDKTVGVTQVSPDITPPPNGSGSNLFKGRPRSGATITPPPTLGKQEFVGEGGKQISISKGRDGKVLYTAPPPPVREITFSGGGAKGNALPGAIQALQDSGVLKNATKIAGASVGSMTAALVAAGITAEEFTKVANSDATTQRVTDGTGGSTLALLGAAIKNKATTGAGNPLTGQGLEDVVREVLDDTLRSRITEYLQESRKKGGKPDQAVVDTAKRISEAKTGATFMDLRILSKAIPAIKEVVITGTYTTEFGEDGNGRKTKLKDGNSNGQLYVFDADTEPNLPVSVAVHASASFPIAFKPVDIKLSSGLTVRFIDGGVMNNTPTTSSIGAERDLDPMPQGRGMTFVFQEKDGAEQNLLQGTAKPENRVGNFADMVTGSNHLGAEYGKNRNMADRPEEIVVVPLKIQRKGNTPFWKSKTIDMRKGTLEFGLALKDKLELQDATKDATNAQIEREKQPKTREFASDSQMFVSIPIGDLKALEANGYAGAKEAVTFRERVGEMIDKLRDAVKKEYAKSDARIANVLTDKDAKMALDELDKLAAGDVDFQGYVGREMNRGGLDTLLEAARAGGNKSDVLSATFAVGDALKARSYADNILKTVVYPKMKFENKKGAGIETLLIMDALLRQVQGPEDVNAALQIGIDHFKDKSDRPPFKRGHKEFAAELQRYMMKP
jgi:exoenzyme U